MKKLSLLLALLLVLLCSTACAETSSDQVHEHVFEIISSTKATCTVAGEEIAACSCGETKTTTIPATNVHEFQDNNCTLCGLVNATHGIMGYDFLYEHPGFAGGTVQFKPTKSGAYTFYWGDDNGKLADHTMVYSGSFAANVTANVSIQSFTAIPKGATKLLAVNANETETYSFVIPKGRLATDTELYAFGSISDTHQGNRYGSISIPYDHFVTAATTLHKKGAIAIGISGDISYRNIESEYITHASAVKVIYQTAPDMPIYTTTGNHEIEGVSTLNKAQYIKYTRNLVDYKSNLSMKFFDSNDLDYVVELPDGSVMIYLHQIYYDYGKATSRLLTDSQLDWLGARLEEYKDHTVFLYFHTFLEGGPGDATSIGGGQYSGSMIPTTEDYKRLDAYFKQYTNVVHFSGHSHFPFDAQFVTPQSGTTNYDKNIDNKNGTYATLIHIPSCAAPRVLSNSSSSTPHAPDRSEGFLVHVYEDYIVFEGYDFVNNQTIAYATYIIQR